MTSNFSSQTQPILDRLRVELSSIRTGRASVTLVENIEVDCYGSKTALKALAALSTPEPRMIVIQPWDKSVIGAIEKAILASSLGLNPVADRDIVRISVPSLTEERRKKLVKTIGQHAESSRIAVRRLREEAIRNIDRTAQSKDEKFRRRSELQKTVDEVNKKIEDSASAKEREVMTV